MKKTRRNGMKWACRKRTKKINCTSLRFDQTQTARVRHRRDPHRLRKPWLQFTSPPDCERDEPGAVENVRDGCVESCGNWIEHVGFINVLFSPWPQGPSFKRYKTHHTIQTHAGPSVSGAPPPDFPGLPRISPFEGPAIGPHPATGRSLFNPHPTVPQNPIPTRVRPVPLFPHKRPGEIKAHDRLIRVTA